MKIEVYTKELIPDVLAFEQGIRTKEEWGWNIDEAYIQKVEASFDDPAFANSFTLLAIMDEHVVGRIDVAIIATHFEGVKQAYLDWICVDKDYRHKGVAQALMSCARKKLYEMGIANLIAIVAHNEEALSFYRNIKNAKIEDQGIWIDTKE